MKCLWMKQIISFEIIQWTRVKEEDTDETGLARVDNVEADRESPTLSLSLCMCLKVFVMMNF